MICFMVSASIENKRAEETPWPPPTGTKAGGQKVIQVQLDRLPVYTPIPSVV